MKKIMIGILIIIPVIILAVVSAVSVVVSTRAHIGVEEVSFDRNSVEIVFGDESYDINDYLTVTVLPEKATDKTCVWEIVEDGMQCFDADYKDAYDYYLAHLGEANNKEVLPPVTLVDADGNKADTNTTGKFKVNASCSFILECRAEGKTARCTVIALDYELKSVVVKGDVVNIKENENLLLSAELSPVDALVERVEWISSDESILTVDSNGVVVGKKEGSAEIVARAYVEGGYVESAPYVITVEKNASLLGNAVSTDVRRIPLSAFGIAENDIVNLVNASIEGDEIVIAEDKNEAQIETAYGVVTLTVEDGIVIKNKNLFAYVDGESSFVFAVGEKLNLEVVWKSVFKADKPQVTWSVDNDRIATVTDGVLEGKGNGIVTVTATCGDYSDVLTLNVREKAVSVIMDKTADEYTDAGLALEYVIPTLKYENIEANKNKVANYIDVELVRPAPPESEKAAFYEAFKFELLENGEVSDKGYFVSNRLYLNHEKVTEKTVLTVKVTAKYPKYPDSTLSYDSVEITVVDGVEVKNYVELKSATDEKYSVCLVNDIELFDGDESQKVYENNQSTYLFCRKAYYGNGFMFSAKPGQLTNTMCALLFVVDDNAVISNGVFRANTGVGDIITSEDTEGLQGSCVIAGARYSGDRDANGNRLFVENIRTEYSIFENGNVLYKALTCENYIEGCIFRNSAGVGIYTRTWALLGEPSVKRDTAMYTKLTTKNCIMSNLTGLGINFDFNKVTNAGEEYRQQLIDEGRMTTYNQLGFLDIYNWQSVNTMKFLPQDVLGNGMEGVVDMFNSLIRDKIADKRLDPYRYTYNREDYFCLGMMSTGALDKSCLTGVTQDPRIKIFNSDMFGTDIKKVIANPVWIITYGNDVDDIIPGSEYKINKKLINRLHGIGVEYGEEVPFSFI